MHWRILCFILIFSGLSLQSDAQGAPIPPEKVPPLGKIAYDFSNPYSPEYKRIIRGLDSMMKYESNVKNFWGGVLIGYKGKIIYEKYSGYSNSSKKQKWNSQTISQLASTSKPFTAAAVLMLHDKGLLNIDDNVKKHIPEFPYKNITVRMLLNHRSGLRDFIKFSKSSNGKIFMNNEDVVKQFARAKPSLMFTPNRSMKYSNSNYAFLASIVERVSGMKFKFFMENFVFKKIGLKNTIIHDPVLYPSSNTALSYKSGRHYKDMFHDGVYGAYGVYSSLRDMYTWDQALYSGKLLSNSTLKQAYKPYSFEKPSVKNYGLGWRMIIYPKSTKIIYHNGWWHGNNTCFYRFIDDNFTIIVLGNKFATRIYDYPMKMYSIINNGKVLNGFGAGQIKGIDP